MIIGVRLDRTPLPTAILHSRNLFPGFQLKAYQVSGIAWLGLALFNFVPLVTAGVSQAHSRT